jgi:hypothetical protein
LLLLLLHVVCLCLLLLLLHGVCPCLLRLLRVDDHHVLLLAGWCHLKLAGQQLQALHNTTGSQQHGSTSRCC